MSNITLDTTGFSEQLGLYDFFNVLISGTIFVFGISITNSNVCENLWKEVTIPKSLGIFILIYTVGLILQEFASILDEKWLNLYNGMKRSVLKNRINDECKIFNHTRIINNPIMIKRYRENAKKILKRSHISVESDSVFDDDYVNGFVFSACQYYVAACGKDKKVEKIRALFNMAKMLMICFALLTFFNLFAWLFNVEMAIPLWSTIVPFTPCCDKCFDRFILGVMFFCSTVIFYYRSQKTMRRFLSILMGTYDAIIRTQSNEIEENEDGKLKVHVRTINKATMHNTKTAK